MSRRHQNKNTAKTISTILAETGITESDHADAAGTRAIVYLADDSAACEKARRIHERYGGHLLPIAPLAPYPTSPAALAARRAIEATWFMASPLDEPADTNQVLAEADILTVVGSLWGKHLAAPIVSFLERHEVVAPLVEVAVLATGDHIAPVLYREVGEALPAGTQVHFTSQDNAEAEVFVAEHHAGNVDLSRNNLRRAA